jgi:hypothetical protein
MKESLMASFIEVDGTVYGVVRSSYEADSSTCLRLLDEDDFPSGEATEWLGTPPEDHCYVKEEFLHALVEAGAVAKAETSVLVENLHLCRVL